MMKTIPMAVIASCLAAGVASAQGVNPKSFKMAVERVQVSANADCSGLATVLDAPGASYTDFSSNPTLGTFALAEGSYACVAFTINSVVKFTPATTSGSCVQGQEFSMDLCAGQPGGCTSVNVYLTTGSPSALAASLARGFPFQIPSPLVVGASSAQTSIFGVDARGRIQPSGAMCGMAPPQFYFESASKCDQDAGVCEPPPPVDGGAMSGGNCGNPGQPCCSVNGTPMCAPGATCNNGQCAAAADAGAPGGTSGNCGNPGQPCCSVNGSLMCAPGATCSNGQCQGSGGGPSGGGPGCGMSGQACCNGQCMPPLACTASVCH